MSRIVCQFSCGAASAVATKLAKFDGVTVYGDLDCTIAAAMASKAEVPNGQ